MTTAPTPSTRPNLIVILSDDHGYADRSATGIHPDVRTPALDRLAAEGVTCTDAYVTAPICSPSRAAIMSGRYQQRWGGLWFDSSEFPPDDLPSMAESVRDQGYRTGYFGKVHYGRERVGDRACPPHHGFDAGVYGLAGQSVGRLNYLHHSAQAQADYGPDAAYWMAVQPLLSGDEPVEHEGFLTAELGRRAREFVAADDDRPFFAMIAFNAVHNFCWQLPPEELARRGLPAYADWSPDQDKPYAQWYDDVIVPNLPHGREYYLAQLELMDAEIGALLDQLDASGQAHDTMIIYLTDNGGSTCNFGDNAPLRGTKYTLWEGGIRVPMIIRWPGRVPAGTAYPGLTSSLDLYPTLVTAAGGTPPDFCDGHDLVDLVDVVDAMAQPGVGHDELHWDCGFQWAVRAGRWKLSVADAEDATLQQMAGYEHAPMGGGTFLADLDADPGEQHDLSGTEPDVVADLTHRHEAWRAAVGLPG